MNLYKKILRKIPNRTKVFCIGWHKTGTTTMGEALSLLNYRVVGPHTGTASFFKQNNIAPLLKKLRRGDACQDMPWPVLFKEMDREFPKAKFILMIRDEKKWLKSIVNWKKQRHSELDEVIYGSGTIEGNQDLYLERYRLHNQSVMAYFENKPGKLLVLNLDTGIGWNALCAFLGKRVPSVPFPHKNKTAKPD